LAVLAYIFNFSSLVDLKNSKCKEILEKLDELEESIYERLHVQPVPREDSYANSPIDQISMKENRKIKQTFSDNALQSYCQRNEQKMANKVPNLILNTLSSGPSKKSTMAKTPRLQISNFNYVTESPQDDESKGLYKYGIQI